MDNTICISPTFPIRLTSRILHSCLLFIVLCSWATGCASIPGKNLPVHSFAGLVPAPVEKTCLAISEGSKDETGERYDKAIALLKQSGYFLTAPEGCTLKDDARQNSMTMVFNNELKGRNLAVALISNIMSYGTLTILPGYQRNVISLTVEIRRNGHLVKEYSYREHMETWTHISMIFMWPTHLYQPTINKMYDGLVMNFLHDYSRDVQQGSFITLIQ